VVSYVIVSPVSNGWEVIEIVFAVAGVINFSLIRKADGLNLDFSYQDTDNYDQSEYNFGALYGWTSKNFDFAAGFNHLDRSPLSAAEIPGIAELALSGLGKTFRVSLVHYR